MERRLALGALAAFVLVVAAILPARGATFTVDSVDDDFVADGSCTLREAVAAHNAVAGANDCGAFDPGADVIEIVATGTIRLEPSLGELEVYAPEVTVNGPGADLLTIDGQEAMSVLVMSPKETPPSLTVRRLTIAHGLSRFPTTNPGGGAIRGTLANGPSPSAILVEDAALVDNSAVSSSFAPTRGGAISSWGSLVLRRTLLARNKAILGGAVFHDGDAVVEDCELRDNVGLALGAALSSLFSTGADWQIRRSLFRGNVLEANGGSAISFESPSGVLEVENSTFEGNAGGSGAAIWVGQAGVKAKVRNSTFADTVATAGFPAGVVHLQGGSSSSVASLTVTSCLFAANDRPDVLDGGFPGTGAIFTSFDLFDTTAANLPPGTVCSSSTAGGANLCGVTSPGLDPLASNGGPTQTMALQPTSPARDAGHNPAALSTDQRGAGYARTVGAATDIGAFESSGKSAPAAWEELPLKGTAFALLGTYFGGKESTPPCKERVDELVVAGGEVYVLGSTGCDGLPGTAGGVFATRRGKNDIFLARLTLDLSTVLQATYFGAGGDEFPTDMVVTDDAVYATGITMSMQLPGTASAAQTHNQSPGDVDGFVVRFDRTLTQLVRTTFLGGDNADETAGLAVAGGELYVAGSTDSSNFPGAAAGAQPAFVALADGFVARLPLSLQGPITSTYLGAAGWDFTTDLAIGGDAVFVTGYTDSSDFPGPIGGSQPALAAGDDAFVARLSLDLAQLLGASYLGGGGADYALALAVSDDDSVYVGGRTSSLDLPFTAGGVQPLSDTPTDGFIARFDSTLAGGVQATYLGAKAADSVNALWAGNGTVWAVGTHGPAGFFDTPGAGGNDAFLAVLDDRLSTLIEVATYGGGSDETGRALAVELGETGEVVGALIGGSTLSKDLPLVTPPAQASRNGGVDGYVARLIGVP